LIYDCGLTSHSEKCLKSLVGNKEIEDSLEKLDKLTQEEARMAAAEQMVIMRGVDQKLEQVNRKSLHHPTFSTL